MFYFFIVISQCSQPIEVTGKQTKTVQWSKNQDLHIYNCLFEEVKQCISLSKTLNNVLLSINQTTFYKCVPSPSDGALIKFEMLRVSYSFQFICVSECGQQSDQISYQLFRMAPVSESAIFASINYFSACNTITSRVSFNFAYNLNTDYSKKTMKNSNFSECNQAKDNNRYICGIFCSQHAIYMSFCNFENNHAYYQTVILNPQHQYYDEISNTNFIYNTISGGDSALIYVNNNNNVLLDQLYIINGGASPSHIYYQAGNDKTTLSTTEANIPITFYQTEHCEAAISYNFRTPDITPNESPLSTPNNTPNYTPNESPYNTPFSTPCITPNYSPYITPNETPILTLDYTPIFTPNDTPSNTEEHTTESDSSISSSNEDYNNPTNSETSESLTKSETLSSLELTSTESEKESTTEGASSNSETTFIDETSTTTSHYIVTSEETSDSTISSNNNEAIDGSVDPNKSTGSNLGVILGCVIGVLVVIIVLIVVIILYRRHKSHESTASSCSSSVEFPVETTVEFSATNDNMDTITLYSTALVDESDPFDNDFEEFYIH